MNTACCNTQPRTTDSREETRRQNEAQPTKPVSFFKPAVDVAEQADVFLVRMDVPGARSETLDIAFEKGELTVTARVQPLTPPGARPLLREYETGDYQRTFRLGDSIDASGIEATLNGGVLTVRLPKAPHAQPRRIEVRTA